MAPAWDLVDQELVSSVARFITIRWLAGLGLLAATWLATAVFACPCPRLPLYVIGVAILRYNAVFYFVLRRLLRTEPPDIIWFHRLTKVQIGLDWLAMTASSIFPGGVESPALFYFFFHIIIAGDPPVAAGHVSIRGYGHPSGRGDGLAGIRGLAAALFPRSPGPHRCLTSAPSLSPG